MRLRRLGFFILISVGSFALIVLLLVSVLRPSNGNVAALKDAKALIGGSFTLTDETGKRVTDQDFRGRLMLVFFGFTNCPDVCPTELQTFSQALDRLGTDAAKVVPVFISIDPERDTPQKTSAYSKDVDRRIVGLSGTPEEVAVAAKAYRVYYRKAETGGGYTMDHSTITYLMDRDGSYITHFSFGTTPDAMATTIKANL